MAATLLPRPPKSSTGPSRLRPGWLMMASAQVVETSVNTNNSPSQDYTTNPDDHSNHNGLAVIIPLSWVPISHDTWWKLRSLELSPRDLLAVFWRSIQYEFDSPCSRLLTIRLHWPTRRGDRAEQRYKRFHLLMFQQRCGFYDRAWYIKACIRYHDLEGKVPHFKHETFSSLPYASDLYSKSLALYVRNRWTELRNWPRTPQTGMSFRNVQFMTPLPSVVLPKQEEENEDYRPVIRQSTVGSETTKYNSGALPPVVYTKQSSVQANVLRIPSKSSNNSDDKVQQVSKPSSERLETPDNNPRPQMRQ